MRLIGVADAPSALRPRVSQPSSAFDSGQSFSGTRLPYSPPQSSQYVGLSDEHSSPVSTAITGGLSTRWRSVTHTAVVALRTERSRACHTSAALNEILGAVVLGSTAGTAGSRRASASASGASSSSGSASSGARTSLLAAAAAARCRTGAGESSGMTTAVFSPSATATSWSGVFRRATPPPSLSDEVSSQ